MNIKELLNKYILRNDIMYWVGGNYVEITGNIHDNPPLLEGMGA